MNEGISIDEACAKNVIGTKEDFDRSCNPDGTMKDHKKTTTFSLKDSDSSVTVDNAHLQVGGVVVVIAAAILLVIIIRRLKRKAK